MKIKTVLFATVAVLIITSAQAQTTLDNRCIVNILNRTIQVSENGGWALPNVPSNMGRVRARATCTQDDGTTVSGQSDYFTLTANGITNVGDIKFEGIEAIPTEINFISGEPIQFAAIGKTQQLKVIAKYRSGQEKDVTSAINGINYSTTNPAVATVTLDGLITARGNGAALINARKDGVLASRRVSVTTSGDLDGDGLPDAWELANGLNSADPVDAQEDKDSDGLSNLDEYKEGTNPALADTDADGLDDFKELKQHDTSPLLADSDGDGLNDNIELLTNTDPRSAASANYAAAVQSISVTPPTVVLTFSGVDTEVSTQLKVTGKLLDGSLLDLTSKSRGTSYTSNNLAVVSFGTQDGKIFGGEAGNAVVTIKNGIHSIPLGIRVEGFTPSALSAINIPGYANNVDVVGDLAFVAAGNAGLQVVDVTNRKSPKIIGSIDTNGVAIDLRVRGNYVYLADGEAGLKIIDVATPATPKLVSSLDTAGVAQDLQIYGNYAYLANGDSGIEVIDISRATEPLSVGTLGNLGEVKGIDIEANIATVVAGSSLHTIDVTDKSGPLKVGSINLGSVKDVVVSNGYAHVAVYGNGYRVVKVKDPANPVVTGGDAVIAPRDVELTNGLAFFAEQLFPNVVAYINIDDPEKPVFQGTIDLGPFGDYAGTGIALDASYAYITEENYVVSQDYGSSGNTKLFIAQYRMLNDNAAVAPTVSLSGPVQGQIVVENKNIILTAVAEDDVAVKQVDFLVDGTLVASDTTPPYEVPYVVPEAKRFINISARARDLGGNESISELVRINIQPDKDKDDLGNDEEGDTYNTDPTNADTDADGLLDGREIGLQTNPLLSDTDNDGLADGAEVTNGTDPLNPDVIKPQVDLTFPLAGAVDVPENQGISIKFNEALAAKSIRQGIFSLKQQGTLEVEGTLKLVSDREILFSPNALLKDYTDYVVIVNGVRDSAGNPLATAFEFAFKTGNTIDTVRPTVATMTPQNNASNVPVNSLLTLIMSEPIDPATISENKIYVRDTVTNQNLIGNLSVSEDKLSISFVPNRAFLVGRNHQLYVSGVKDLFGNEMHSSYFYFTTAFDSDGKSPEMLAASLSSGDTDVPLNSTLRALFSEPINGLSLQLISIEQNGRTIPSERTIGNNNRTLAIKPIAPLDANTTYEFVIGAVSDLSGNLLAREQRISFTTGALSDTQRGSTSSYTPANNATQIPLGATIEARFNERFDPATVTARTFVLTDESENKDVEGRIEISADRKGLTFVPTQPLKAGHRYYLWSSYHASLYDLAGNSFNYHYWYFNTGNAVDTQAPAIAQSNFASGTENLPINARVQLAFNEPLNTLCVNNQTVTLVKSDDASVIAGKVTLTNEGRTLTFVANSNLLPSAKYELVVNNVCDLSGNKLSGVKHSFTTGSGALADTTRPTLTAIVPASNTSGVTVTTPIVATFNEAIDPLQLGNLQVTASGMSGQVAGSWAVSGTTLTFTPFSTYPSSSSIYVYFYGIQDIAGNEMNGTSRNFTTGVTSDTTPPQVVMMTPGNGAMDIGPLTPIVLTFSESLRESTVNNTNFTLFANGNVISPSVYRSADNRTVTLSTTLPAATSVTVVVTSDVTDHAGNKLADYAATFSTAVVNADTSRPSIVSQSPISGATNVRQLERIVLYANKQLNAGTLTDAVHVAANGVLIGGTVSLDATSQAVTFVPTQPFPDNALIEVFLTDKLRDLSSNLLHHYTGSFRMGSSLASRPNVAPTLQAHYPNYGLSNVVLNPLIEASFDQALKASSVNANTIQIRKDYSGAVHPADISLSENGRVIRVKPLTALDPNAYYYVRFYSGLEDMDGDKFQNETYFYFRTDANAIADTQAPVIQRTSPSDGALDVPVNPTFHARFDEAIHPFSMQAKGNDQITFLAGNTEIRYVKDHVLTENTEHTETWSGLSDVSGNLLTDHTIKFKTGNRVDTKPPAILSVTPRTGATNVPVNAPITILMNEAINTVNLGNFYLYDTVLGTRVSASTSVSSDGRQLSLTPLAPLAVNRAYYVYTYPVYDLANNLMHATSSFTTGLVGDTEAPQISTMGIDDGQTDLAVNARLRIRFNEPINVQTLAGITLTLNGTPVVVDKSWSDDRLQVVLIPLQLLQPGAHYTLSVSGVKDLSGNSLVTPASRSFITSAKVDTIRGGVASYTPVNNVTNVALNATIEARFNERFDPATVTARTFVLTDESENKDVEGRIEISADRKGLTFVPTQPLKAGHRYYLWSSYHASLYDLAGNSFNYHYWYFNTVNQ